MIRSILLVLLSLVLLTSAAQTSKSIFEWKEGSSITFNKAFVPLLVDSDQRIPDPKHKVYDFKSYIIKTGEGATYTVKLHSTNKDAPKNGYDGFSILHQGKSIISYNTMDPLNTCESITLEKDKSHFLQIPLDNKSFALCFGGWNYGLDDAPELVIVVVSEGKAKVVFDSYAYAYKYTPAPNFSIEYVDNITGLYEKEPFVITPSFLRNRTKHKIWREGNVLKYKSWK